MNNAVLVLTARGPERLLIEGGSQAWRLNEDRARESEFLVCVQNRHNGEWGGATMPHGTAFLIGRITEIVPSPERPKRWLIKVGEYARIDVPNVWQAWQYPVRYMSLEELEIDPTKLTWETMPDVAETSKPDSSKEAAPMNGAGVKALTMAEAKQGLALTFNVPPEAVEITIRG